MTRPVTLPAANIVTCGDAFSARSWANSRRISHEISDTTGGTVATENRLPPGATRFRHPRVQRLARGWERRVLKAKTPWVAWNATKTRLATAKGQEWPIQATARSQIRGVVKGNMYTTGW